MILRASASPLQIGLLLVFCVVIVSSCITVLTNLFRSGHADLDHRPARYKPRKRA